MDLKDKLIIRLATKTKLQKKFCYIYFSQVAFIEKYVPQDARIHFIGHSIGCYIILKLLQNESIQKRVVKSYMLFPTIEYMAETKNGIFLTSIIKRILWLIIFLSWIFTFIPTIIQNFLIYLYLQFTCTAKMHLKTIRGLVDPLVLENVFFMAYKEMDEVKGRDNETLRKNKDKIKLYYGASDGWAPTEYCLNLKNDVPGIDAEICVRNFNHAFVLNCSRQVGSMVANWISSK